MMRIYVETNFLVDILRPLPKSAAVQLYAKHPEELSLSIPWCSLKEAARTLDRIIREDLGFADNAGRLLSQLVQSDPTKRTTLAPHINQFIDEVRQRQARALSEYVDKLEDFAQRVDVIGPSPEATDLSLDLNRAKKMKPFDEAILGCILADASKRKNSGERALKFCSTNFKDFSPTQANGLLSAYQTAGLEYLNSFNI